MRGRALRALLCALALPSAAPKTPRNESYAVLLYGSGGYVAGALVLGGVLRRVDAARHRTALVANVTTSARAALAADGLYEIRDATELARHGSGAAPWPGRKLDLWALPFEKVLFLDLDLMLLPSGAKHLLKLWDAPLAKASEASAGDVAALPPCGVRTPRFGHERLAATIRGARGVAATVPRTLQRGRRRDSVSTDASRRSRGGVEQPGP